MTFTPFKLYNTLYKQFGKQYWWPMDIDYHKKNISDPRFEVIIGAILTQNTAWSNVEKAIINLKENNLLEIKKISEIKLQDLQELIKPSGFFIQKSKRVKNIAKYLKNNYKSNLDKFFSKDLHNLREELLSLNGIGPETADSILLYAGNKPIFVVDAYTRRISKRIPLDTKIDYEDIQNYFQKNLKENCKSDEITFVYNELHALIVELAKNYCKKRNPLCSQCPLDRYCEKKDLF